MSAPGEGLVGVQEILLQTELYEGDIVSGTIRLQNFGEADSVRCWMTTRWNNKNYAASATVPSMGWFTVTVSVALGITMPNVDAVVKVEGQHLEGENWVTDSTMNHSIKLLTITPPPNGNGGLPKGVIEMVGLPTEAQIDIYNAFNVTVHNIGDTGVFGLGIVNDAGSPGNIVLKSDGVEEVVSPGFYLRHYYVDAKPSCTRLTVSGEIKFLSIGTYTIKVWGMHLEGGSWIYDDEKSFSIVVTEEYVEPTAWEKLKEFMKERPLTVVVGVGSVVGGVILYQQKSRG